MVIASKKTGCMKPRRRAVPIKAPAVRVEDLLGDFSEQTGALFG